MIARWIALPIRGSCLIFGPRRAGKTTLLQQKLPNVLYVTLDDYDVLQLAQKDPKACLQLGVNEYIIDEVQRAPNLLVAIKNQIDNHRARVWMTGSSSLGLLSHGVETLAGRIKLLECPTLCWGEENGSSLGQSLEHRAGFLQNKEASRSLSNWLAFGGFPQVRAEKNNATRLEILKDYKNSYFARDLLLMSNIENARGLLACMNHLSLSLGSRTDISALAKESALSYPTALKYLNVLEASRLVFRLAGYQYGPSKRQIKSNKYYFSDVSIVTALNVAISEGQRFEQFVVSELEKRRKLDRFQADFLYFYETEKGREVDVIIDEGTQVLAIEIKNTENPSPRDVTNLRNFELKKRKGKLRKVLITRSLDYGKIGDVELWPVTSLCQHL